MPSVLQGVHLSRETQLRRGASGPDIREGFLGEVTSGAKSCQVRGLGQGKEHGFILTFSDAAPILGATESLPETAQSQGQSIDEETEVQSGQGAPLSSQDREHQSQDGLTLVSVHSWLEAGAARAPRPDPPGLRSPLGRWVTSKSLCSPDPPCAPAGRSPHHFPESRSTGMLRGAPGKAVRGAVLFPAGASLGPRYNQTDPSLLGAAAWCLRRRWRGVTVTVRGWGGVG